MHEVVIAALAIVAIALILGMTLTSIVGKVVEGKRLRHETRNGAAGPELREVLERQQQIEERLRVLERIATDRGSLLADEIEALRRDTPAIPARETEATAQ